MPTDGNVNSMKLNTEDEELPPLDSYLQLLMILWRENISVNSVIVERKITVIPAPDQSLTMDIRNHWELLAHYLPGECDACQKWVLTRTEVYWGAHPHLCPRCVELAIIYFELNDGWPDANWYEGEC